MAHRLLNRGTLNAPTRMKEFCQRFNYLLILDFEATCEKDMALKPAEIIEFPCLVLSTEDWQIKDEFHEYVRPRVNPTLTPFCTELTGIMQDAVDGQPHFPVIFSKFNEWLAKSGFLRNENTSAFVTCGDWDLRVMLPSQCALEGLELPSYYERWIDLKRSYCDATNYYPRSLKDMLVRSDIPVQGRLHSGLCDTWNMSRIIRKLNQNHSAIFEITSTAEVTIKDSLI